MFTADSDADLEASLASWRRIRRARGPFGLTIQEMRVVELLPRGLTNKEIGHELGVSESTVKTHLRHAMRKMQASDRTEAAAIAMREGLA